MSAENDAKPSVSDRLQEMLDRHGELNSRYQVVFIASGILTICCAVGFGLTISTNFAVTLIGATFFFLGLLGFSLSRGAGYHASQMVILNSMFYKVRGMETDLKELRVFKRFCLEVPISQETVDEVLRKAARDMDIVFAKEIFILQQGEGLPERQGDEDHEAFMQRFNENREEKRQSIEIQKSAVKTRYNELCELLKLRGYKTPKSYKDLLVEKPRGLHLEN